MFDNLAASAPLIKDGKVKALAVTTAKRSSLLADVPTVQESGVQGFDLGTWFGVFTTGGTPAPVVAKLNQAYADAMKQDDVKQRLLTMGSEAGPMTPGSLRRVRQERKGQVPGDRQDLGRQPELIRLLNPGRPGAPCAGPFAFEVWDQPGTGDSQAVCDGYCCLSRSSQIMRAALPRCFKQTTSTAVMGRSLHG